MTIKKKIETKYRLPNLNWIALKPQQVKGTVFCELDDEKLLKVGRLSLFVIAEMNDDLKHLTVYLNR